MSDEIEKRDPDCPGRKDCVCDVDLACDPPGGELRGRATPTMAEVIQEAWYCLNDPQHEGLTVAELREVVANNLGTTVDVCREALGVAPR
jgi:hypothetical protein